MEPENDSFLNESHLPKRGFGVLLKGKGACSGSPGGPFHHKVSISAVVHVEAVGRNDLSNLSCGLRARQCKNKKFGFQSPPSSCQTEPSKQHTTRFLHTTNLSSIT